MTDDKRDKNGRFVKGSKVNQGCTHSLERRTRHSEAMKGRSLSDEHKEKIRVGILASDKVIGRPKGGIPWNKGMGVKKVRFVNDAKFKKGLVPWNKGLPCAEETKIKIGSANKGREMTAEHIRKILTRRTPTSLEKKFQEIIERNGLPYKFVGDGSFMVGRKNPDFININGKKVAIEVYSLYYKLRHSKTLDEWKNEREKVFNEYGWQILFFDAVQVNEKNVLEQLRAV